MKKKFKPKRFISRFTKSGNSLCITLPKDIERELNLTDKKGKRLRGYVNENGMVIFDPNLLTDSSKEMKEVMKQYDERRTQEKKDDMTTEIAQKVVSAIKGDLSNIKVEQVNVESKEKVTTKKEEGNSLIEDMKLLNSFPTKKR